jgi:tetratricopeptide (TPR) repeat protein
MIPIVVLFLIFSFPYKLFSCSLVKMTAHGKTVVGNNEDFQNPDTRIWFEPGSGKEFGAVYVGYNNLFPEGGINEAGLMFDAFGVDNKPLKDTTGKFPIFELDLKRRIMKECSTVRQAHALISMYNLYFWSHAVWVFIDKTGNYLIVDGDSKILGNDRYFVHTNFRHSEIKNKNDICCARYLKAISLLKNRCEADIDYCTALMDSVHVESTLYTTVYDLNAGTIDLYHYHNYSNHIRFNVKDELKKGKRILRIPELFPEIVNPAYSGMLNLKAQFDSLAFYFTAKDSSRRTAVINGLKTKDYTIHVMENYGYEYLHLGDIQKAIGIFTLVTEFYPKMPHGYHFLGEAYMENKQYSLALASYKHSVEIYPADVGGRQRIAVLNKLLKN